MQTKRRKTNLILLGDREATTTRRKTSAGPGGSSEGKSTARGTSKGKGFGGKQSPTPHSSDGPDGASESSEKLLPRIVRFRWIIPAQGEIRARLRFVSNEVGQFDQTISFEIVGTKRNYKIFSRGVCTFPTISREPRSVIRKQHVLHSLKFILLELFFLIDKKHVNQMKSFIKNSFFLPNNMISVHSFSAKISTSMCINHSLNISKSCSSLSEYVLVSIRVISKLSQLIIHRLWMLKHYFVFSMKLNQQKQHSFSIQLK